MSAKCFSPLPEFRPWTPSRCPWVIAHHRMKILCDYRSNLSLRVDSSLRITHRSFRYAARHLWNKLPTTLRVPYQFDPSLSPSSSPSSYSDPGPLVDLSHGVFYFCLKTFLFSKYFPHNRLFLLKLISWNYDHSLFGSHWRRYSIGKCGRLSEPMQLPAGF